MNSLSVVYVSDRYLWAQWAYPDNYLHQPNLIFHVFVDTSRVGARAENNRNAPPQWEEVATTAELRARVDGLVPNTAYRLAIRCESAFGSSPQVRQLSFATRSVPNPAEYFPKVDGPGADAGPAISGLEPLNLHSIAPRNLFDKYEVPRRRRLKALSALSGISAKKQRVSNMASRLRVGAAKALTALHALESEIFRILMSRNFSSDDLVDPICTAHRNLGMPDNDLAWNASLFVLEESAFMEALSPDLHIANTFGKMAVEKEQEASLRQPRSAGMPLEDMSQAPPLTEEGEKAADAIMSSTSPPALAPLMDTMHKRQKGEKQDISWEAPVKLPSVHKLPRSDSVGTAPVGLDSSIALRSAPLPRCTSLWVSPKAAGTPQRATREFAKTSKEALRATQSMKPRIKGECLRVPSREDLRSGKMKRSGSSVSSKSACATEARPRAAVDPPPATS